MSRHLNIPIFIPHLGCPHTCVFCNQRSISGAQSFDPAGVDAQITAALATTCENDTAEIAYFGGSFTGIDRDLMVYLLDVAERYVQKPLAGKARVAGIRMSTRPDYISDEILEILARYSVRTVELGVQSMTDAVLTASGRGHDAESAAKACRMLSDAGYDVIGQMMIGLPGSTEESEVQTARALCELGVRGARIYPTVVFADTELCAMMHSGAYTPLSAEQAVCRSAAVLRVFEAHNVPVIRIGLCASDNCPIPRVPLREQIIPPLERWCAGSFTTKKSENCCWAQVHPCRQYIFLPVSCRLRSVSTGRIFCDSERNSDRGCALWLRTVPFPHYKKRRRNIVLKID